MVNASAPNADTTALVPPSDERANRRHRRSRLVTTGLVLALLFGAAACGSDDGKDDGAADTEVDAEIGDAATIESSTTVDTAVPEPTVTETTVAAPSGAPDPEAAAAMLYGAWKAGDRAAAATVAEPFAVDGIFEAVEGDYSLYNRCNTGEFGQSSCLYRSDAGTIQFSMNDRGGAWVVTTAIFSEA